MPAQYKTPGVYVRELSAFPPSVVGVETAVPAFIGYTETALLNGKPITMQPIEITSLADYEQIFGGDYAPNFDVKAPPTPATPSAGAPATSVPAYDFRIGDHPYVVQQDPAKNNKFYLYNSLRLFYANGGGTCYIVSVGPYADASGTPAAVSADPLTKGLAAIHDQVGPTMLVIPDALLLASAGYQTLVQAMLAQCGELQDRVAILDVYQDNTFPPAAGVQDALNQLVESFQGAVGSENLSYGMAYFPTLRTSVVQASDMTFASFSRGSIDTLKQALSDEVDLRYGPSSPSPSTSKVTALKAEVAKIGDATANNQTVTNDLMANLPVLKQVFAHMAGKLNVLPASGAMAGIYTHVDGVRGVWNAPANIALAGVVGPTFKITGKAQEDLNVPVNGKAINAIREFVGQGTLVWGARTLDGNSNDYRYIQVRRTLVYVEQSTKAALNAFVFAPNDATTWVSVTAMISNFLTSLWTQGGLMGAKASEAFTVQCGLGSTMTGQDILNGYMRVQVTLQMIHPAEFIELTFTQKMQGVG